MCKPQTKETIGVDLSKKIPVRKYYTSLKEDFMTVQVSGAKAGTVVYPPQGRFGPRIQNHLQLVLLHTGEMTVYIDGSALRVPPAHVALLKPGHREEFQFATDQDTWHRWISSEVSFPDEDARKYWESLPGFLPLSEKMNRIVDLMLSMQAEDRPSYLESLASLGRAALQLYEAECRQQDAERSIHPSVLLTKSWIHRHYPEDISLNQLASVAGVTPEHLIRLFRKHLAVTPIQYLWNHRIERGLHLLRHTGLSVGEVAEQCGFKTSYHFTRSIKQFSGKSPTDVRRQSWHAGE
ncbi:MAG: AraC family transcriptional regulator [Paenibacillaceae bacterium]|nr:AraC family transcriptional regulator [Paenibacillaceae bacterium]